MELDSLIYVVAKWTRLEKQYIGKSNKIVNGRRIAKLPGVYH